MLVGSRPTQCVPSANRCERQFFHKQSELTNKRSTFSPAQECNGPLPTMLREVIDYSFFTRGNNRIRDFCGQIVLIHYPPH